MDDLSRVTFQGLTPYLHYEHPGAMLEWLGESIRL